MKQTKKKTEHKFGHIFNEFDYQFYKGIMYFYDKKYAEASKNFKRALDFIESQASTPSVDLD